MYIYIYIYTYIYIFPTTMCSFFPCPTTRLFPMPRGSSSIHFGPSSRQPNSPLSNLLGLGLGSRTPMACGRAAVLEEAAQDLLRMPRAYCTPTKTHEVTVNSGAPLFPLQCVGHRSMTSKSDLWTEKPGSMQHHMPPALPTHSAQRPAASKHSLGCPQILLLKFG